MGYAACTCYQVIFLQPFYKNKEEKYVYKRGADGMFPAWPVDWMSKLMRPVLTDRRDYWAGDATVNSVMFCFALNKDGSIPKNSKSQLSAAITRLEGNVPIDARVEEAVSDADDIDGGTYAEENE
jgi:hypothetical protein